MPPPPPSLAPRTPAQRESLFQLIHRSVGTIAAVPGRKPDRLVGSHEPLNGWEIAGTVVGGLVGVVILFGILYYCWEHCRPRATYYETAVQISKKRAACQRRKRERRAQHPSRRAAPSRYVYPEAYADELAAPAATKAHFNEGQIYHWEV
ncbi:hypothetical protein F5X97DRAFT_321746 [Nemania serpens]|nr:hypothetical protein F5X97DRAFT_321746 [Nemania serpens]